MRHFVWNLIGIGVPAAVAVILLPTASTNTLIAVGLCIVFANTIGYVQGALL